MQWVWGVFGRSFSSRSVNRTDSEDSTQTACSSRPALFRRPWSLRLSRGACARSSQRRSAPPRSNPSIERTPGVREWAHLTEGRTPVPKGRIPLSEARFPEPPRECGRARAWARQVRMHWSTALSLVAPCEYSEACASGSCCHGQEPDFEGSKRYRNTSHTVEYQQVCSELLPETPYNAPRD